MRIDWSRALPIIITALLCSPLAASCLQSARVHAAQERFARQELRLPDSLEQWHIVADAPAVTQHDVVLRVYANESGERRSVVVRQNPSLGLVHDLFCCLDANGLEPEVLQQMVIRAGDKSINVAVVKFHRTEGNSIGLTWFQQGEDTAALRSNWRSFGISGGNSDAVIKQCLVSKRYSKPAINGTEDLQRLAAAVYRANCRM